MPATFPPNFPTVYNFVNLQSFLFSTITWNDETFRVSNKIIDISGNIDLRKYFRYNVDPVNGYFELGYIEDGFIE